MGRAKVHGCFLYIVMYHCRVPRSVNISTARKDLPALFDRVTKEEGAKVVIRRRDQEREAVLVSRDYVDRLERGARQRASKGFRLVGSGTLMVQVDEVLSSIRAADDAESTKRAGELAPRRRPGR